ncbi:hypothetical protein QOZ80_1AG0010770 [Eleusine coracana subsp. coracana]|nr:hypothetical protein QOZ80_1AG0010770 [Eleusine coracana subsp. coracana]
MPRKWQVWGNPDGTLVWIPAPDEPSTSPPPAAAAGPPDPPSPGGAPIEGPGGNGGSRVSSMADLLLEARSKLLEGDTVAGATEDVGKGGLICTGSGSSVAVSERAVKRARALIGKEGEEQQATNKAKQPFSNDTCADAEPSKTTDVALRGGVLGNSLLPIFQTGSGNTVSLREASIQKARALLEDNDENTAGAGQPIFRTGMGTSVTVSRGSIDKARAVLKGQTISNEGDVGCVDSMEQVPLFQTGSGRAVPVNMTSIQKAKAVLEENSINEGNAEGPDHCLMFQNGWERSSLISERSIEGSSTVIMDEDAQVIGQRNTSCHLPIFQTGLGRPVAVKQSSFQKAKIVLEGEDVKRSGNGDTSVCALSFQTETPKSVLMSSSVIMNDKTVTPEGNTSWQVEGNNNKVVDHLPMFQTGSGRVVAVSKSSIKRASAILEPRNIAKELEDEAFLDDGGATSLFKTGSGRSVLTSNNSKEKAHIVLEAEEGVKGENPMVESGAQQFVHETENSGHNASIPLEQRKLSNKGHEDCRSPFPMFQTGSGKSVSISERSMWKARAVLEEKVGANRDSHSPLNTKKQFPIFDSPLKSATVKTVNISSLGVSRAATLLGLEENTLSTQLFGHVGEKLDRFTNGKRIMGGRSSISPFKRPRSSRFTTPIRTSKPSSAGESKLLSDQISPCRAKLSSCYPFQHQRKTYKEYFGGPPCFVYLTEHVTDDVKFMNPKRAEKYKFQHMGTGADELQKMLHTCGASLSYATKEWVSNHYKWIVWKLASLERCYPTRAGGKFLTVANVFEELKYRYDREVNHGHRSAIKKILEGNASPSLMMVLCISAIYSSSDLNNNKLEGDKVETIEDINNNKGLSAANKNISAKIELTDGWYSLNATLDVALSEQLEKQKLFLGQKLRIWGASLCGWSGPVSFSEASGTITLMVHINGTYRARWNESLGFCKGVGLPLAFNCIKASGGKVPRALVGVTRIYPVLYRERLCDGCFIVRSERLERKALQLYQQRVSKIAEDIMFEQQENCDSPDDNEEGAKICKMLERAAEPEAIIAGMTSEQLMHFSSYKEKQKVVMQNKVVKKVEKALEVAGLSSRDVTPFLKVRVVGLVSKDSASKASNKEGLITIWNPTEMQKADLVEGQVYSVTGLMPSNYCTATLYLHARGSSTMWKPLASSQTTSFKPFYTPRKAIELSKFGEVPLSSEFDIAGVILYVGTIYSCSNQKRQWLFLTDGSKFVSGQKPEDLDCLLAVSVSSPTAGGETAIFSYALNGNIVGFSNLVKRQKDQMNQIWVAEATESSTFTLSHEIPTKCHLKEAATSVERWVSRSYPKIQELKERVLCIVGDSGG